MKEKVIAFGTFDLLHKGHIHYLKDASSYGELYVVVARDKNVIKVKARKPIHNEIIRLCHVSKLPFVHEARLGFINDKYRIIEDIKPSTICLGYDQNISARQLKSELRKRKVKARIVRLKAYKPHIYKTSKLIHKT